jgi:hypothetical protein
MRPLSEDTLFDRLLRFLLGAAMGVACALLMLAMNYVIIGHVHPLLAMALFGIGGGILMARRVPRA